MSADRLLDEFRRSASSLRACGEALASAIDRDLVAASLPIHFVRWRLKSEPSLKQKLARPDRTYRGLWEITDLVGVRIATYFEDSIEEVSRRIEQMFTVDFRHSSDKLRVRAGDVGRFGYRSVHYVCRAPEALGLPAAFRFEIQLRTVLQHAWAEVEHDLGYKADDAVPESILRRFSRVASLLEIADQEFVSIRADLARHRQRVQQALTQPGSELPIDRMSLEAIARSAPIDALDRAIAARLDRPVVEEIFFPDYLVQLLRHAGWEGAEHVWRGAEALRLAPEAVDRYLEFARAALGFSPAAIDVIKRGYSLLVAAHLAIVRGPELGLAKVERLRRIYRELDGLDEDDAHHAASTQLAALAPD